MAHASHQHVRRTSPGRITAQADMLAYPYSPFINRLLEQARKDRASAALLRDDNPKRAYESLYDAARMALTAVQENEGLRPTSRGGHIASYTAVAAQLVPPMGTALKPFDRMRRT